MDELEITGELRDWRVSTTFFGDTVVLGLIYNDSKRRFLDGEYIHTSSVRKLDLEKGLVYTKNSIYRLVPNE